MSRFKPQNEVKAALSVVVISFNDTSPLDDCLSALIVQPDFQDMEIHIISKQKMTGITKKYEQFIQVHWHQVAATQTVPKMRSLGIEQSNGNLIALLEDDCIVGPMWSQSVIAAHQSDHMAVGGAIEPGQYERGLDWAVFYCEFARFLLPFSGCVTALPGNNVAYKSKDLASESISHGFYEVFAHENWKKSGAKLLAVDGMVVCNKNTWDIVHCTSVPFHHGRAYAGQRFGAQYSTKRLVYGFASILLPFIKSARTLRQVRSRQRAELPLLRALPWIIVFQSCWSLGELLGYLTGPGNSIEKWN